MQPRLPVNALDSCEDRHVTDRIVDVESNLPPEKRQENELESATERRRTYASESIQRSADHRYIARARSGRNFFSLSHLRGVVVTG